MFCIYVSSFSRSILAMLTKAVVNIPLMSVYSRNNRNLTKVLVLRLLNICFRIPDKFRGSFTASIDESIHQALYAGIFHC